MVEAGVENGASRIDVCGEPQVRDRRKMLPSIKELLKGYLCSIFSANVAEREDKFCLLLCWFTMHYLFLSTLMCISWIVFLLGDKSLSGSLWKSKMLEFCFESGL